MTTTLDDHVSVIEFPTLASRRLRNGGMSVADTLGRVAWVLGKSFDVIHAFDHRPAVSFPALVGRRRGAVLVSDWADLWGTAGIGGEREGAAGWILRKADDYWELRFRRFVDGVTVISQALSNRVKSLGGPGVRQMLLPPGANVDLIRPLPKSQARRRYDLPEDAHIVVSTGFAPYDERLLAETVGEILTADPVSWVVTSGARSTILERAVRRRSMEGRLRMLGSVPFEDLEKVLACADVLLLPFSAKAVNLARFPNRFGDFLAAGRAIVTNRTGDLGELVASRQLGVLAREDPSDMAHTVVELFRDHRRAEALGERGRRFAEEEYSWRRFAAGVERYYTDLLAAEGR